MCFNKGPPREGGRESKITDDPKSPRKIQNKILKERPRESYVRAGEKWTKQRVQLQVKVGRPKESKYYIPIKFLKKITEERP